MTYTSLWMNLLMSPIFAVSFVVPQPVYHAEVIVEDEAIIETAITSPVVDSPVVQADVIVTEDCSEYHSIFEKYEWDVAIAKEICKYESSGVHHAVGDKNTEYVSCGLMQIRTLPGRPSCEELQDVETNIAYAYNLYKESGWKPWSVCRTKVNCNS